MCGIAAVHKHTDGTYFLLASDGYWVYSQDKDTGEEDLAGTVSYTEIANLPLTPQRYMGFQPSLQDDVFLLLLGNMVVPVTFENKQIQLSEQRAGQLVKDDQGDIWCVREIALN